jgi:hypothetical protein
MSKVWTISGWKPRVVTDAEDDEEVEELETDVDVLNVAETFLFPLALDVFG